MPKIHINYDSGFWFVPEDVEGFETKGYAFVEVSEGELAYIRETQNCFNNLQGMLLDKVKEQGKPFSKLFFDGIEQE